MPDIDKMSDSEIVDYLKQRNRKKATNVVAEFIEDKLTQSGIEIKCPKCGSENITQYTRVIGYLRPIKAFGNDRQEEANKRTYSNNI